jgi:hypothetical protein
MEQVSLPPLTDNLAAKIIGIWTLKSREDVDAEGQILIDPFLGRIQLEYFALGQVIFRPSS